MSGIWLHDHNCGFKAYRAEAAKSLQLTGQLHRYIPVLAAANGFENISEVKIHHRKRMFGRTKYGMSRFIYGLTGLIAVMAPIYVERLTLRRYKRTLTLSSELYTVDRLLN